MAQPHFPAPENVPQTPDDHAHPVREWRLGPLLLHRPIHTGAKHVPWRAVFILSFMWFTWGFHLFAGGQALTFTIQKYTTDPRLISLIGTFASVVMLAPLVSYLSDQIWTRHGRRRPFVIIGWLGGFLGMLSFAFLPQVLGGINGALGLVGIPAVGDLVLLAIIVGGYKKLIDGMAPLEPLFMECVPPDQRGRFFAIRGILFTLSVTLFFQVFWPVFDDQLDMFAWLGHQGVLEIQGEQVVYLCSAGLFFVTGLYLVFCIEERKAPHAPNKRLYEMFFGGVGTAKTVLGRLRQIPIVTFVVGFFKEVFFNTKNYPFYIILVIPAMEAAVWGNFGALMQNDQFGYSKSNQALWALPMQLVSMCLLIPFAGWYSDVRLNVKWPIRAALLVVSACCFAAMVWMYRTYAPADIRELPALWVLFAITLTTAFGVACVYVPMVETLLDVVGRDHARAWVALLTVAKSMLNVLVLYLVIRAHPNHTPPILLWMVFAVVTASMAALMDTFIAPMIYDYMPRSLMGTINSGVGIYTTIVNFIVPNLGAWWVVFYSTHFYHMAGVSGKNAYDYTSMYLMQFALFVPAVISKVYFIRLIAQGRMKKWGVMEAAEMAAADEAEEKAAG